MKQLVKVYRLICVVFLGTAMLSCATSSQKQDLNDFRFLEFTIEQMQEGFDNGDFTIEQVVKAYLNRIDQIDHNGPCLGSILTVNPDAIAIAQSLDAELKEGEKRGPLHGIPVVLKDNIDTHDKMPTTAGSRALANSFPLEDSHVAKQLRQAGAVIIGKASLSEWANFRGVPSSSGWGGFAGETKNPYDITRNPCGSSSGSGVAVSANLAMLSIGTETDGSIVCPSHANGIVGMKPTVGLISRSGVIPIAETQDSPGPMGRTVTDVAICLGALVGVDPTDARTLASDGNYYSDYTQFLKAGSLEGKRIGFFTGVNGISYKVDTVMSRAIRQLEDLGAEVIEVRQVVEPMAGRNSFEVMLYEYKDGLNKYFATLGPDAPIKSLEELIEFNKNDSIELRYYNQLYLELAQSKGSLESPEYLKALADLKEQTRTRGIDKVMDELKLDAIVAPTGTPAWKTDLVNGDNYSIGTSSPSAQAGYPIISVPMGSIEGLPVGISFYGRAWSEPVLLEIAYAFEQKTNHRFVPTFINAQ